MNNEKINLKKATSFYLVGTLFNKGIGFITVPIFTRILTVEDYGIVTTYNSWVTIMTMIISLALYMSVRSSFIDYLKKADQFLSSIITFTLLYGSILTILAVTVINILPENIDSTLIILCFIQALATALIEEISMFLMMKYNYKVRTCFMVLPNLFSTIIAIIIILYVFDGNLYMGRILPNVVVTSLFGVAALMLTYRKSKPIIKWEYVSYGLKISLPLVLHGIALNILSQSDRTMITLIRNSTETGIYGLIYNFSMIATVLTTALEGVWVPWFTRKMNQKSYNEINVYVKKYISFMTTVMIVVVLVGPELVKLLATKQYWEGLSIIPPLVLSNYIIFIYTLFVNIEHYYKKTVFISINTCIAAGTNIILNIFFINEFGYVGAAYATFISYVVSLILHCCYAKRLNSKLYNLSILILPSFYIFSAVIIFYIFLNFPLLRWITVVLCMLIFLIKEKEDIILFFKG